MCEGGKQEHGENRVFMGWEREEAEIERNRDETKQIFLPRTAASSQNMSSAPASSCVLVLASPARHRDPSWSCYRKTCKRTPSYSRSPRTRHSVKPNRRLLATILYSGPAAHRHIK